MSLTMEEDDTSIRYMVKVYMASAGRSKLLYISKLRCPYRTGTGRLGLAESSGRVCLGSMPL